MEVGEAVDGVKSDSRPCVSSCAVNCVMDRLRGIEMTELKRESPCGDGRDEVIEIEELR